MTALPPRGYRVILVRWLRDERSWRLLPDAVREHHGRLAGAIESGEPERWWAEQQSTQHKCEYKPTATGRQFVCVCGAYAQIPTGGGPIPPRASAGGSPGPKTGLASPAGTSFDDLAARAGDPGHSVMAVPAGVCGGCGGDAHRVREGRTTWQECTHGCGWATDPVAEPVLDATKLEQIAAAYNAWANGVQETPEQMLIALHAIGEALGKPWEGD